MSDRLHEIGMKGCANATTDDVVWLFQTVHRLQQEVTALNIALMNCTVEMGMVDGDD